MRVEPCVAAMLVSDVAACTQVDDFSQQGCGESRSRRCGSRCEVRSPHAACGVSCTVLIVVNHHTLLPTPMVHSLPRYREVLAVNAQVEADAASARDAARAAQAHEKAAVGERDEALARAAQAEAALAALRAAHEAQASQLVRSVAASRGR